MAQEIDPQVLDAITDLAIKVNVPHIFDKIFQNFPCNSLMSLGQQSDRPVRKVIVDYIQRRGDVMQEITDNYIRKSWMEGKLFQVYHPIHTLNHDMTDLRQISYDQFGLVLLFKRVLVIINEDHDSIQEVNLPISNEGVFTAEMTRDHIVVFPLEIELPALVVDRCTSKIVGEVSLSDELCLFKNGQGFGIIQNTEHNLVQTGYKITSSGFVECLSLIHI